MRYELSDIIEIGNEMMHTYVVFMDDEGHYDVYCSCLRSDFVGAFATNQ